MEITITIDDAEARRRIQSLNENDLGAAISVAIASEAVLSKAKTYPAQKREKQAFKSDKQRRFFFAALRSGRITVPYRRTYELYNNWRVVSPSPFQATVENRTAYAETVLGLPEKQANYHREWWRSIDRIAAEVEESEAANIGEKAATLVIQRASLAP